MDGLYVYIRTEVELSKLQEDKGLHTPMGISL